MSQIIDQEIIDDIAHLARLGLSEDEKKEIAAKLQDVLSHFATLQDIDTKGVATSDDVTGLTNVTREDKAGPERLATTKQLMDRAPDTKKGQIRVKAVFKD